MNFLKALSLVATLLVSSLPSVSFDKQNAKVIIRYFSCAAHEKVGRNQSCCPGKLPFTTFYLSDHRPMLQLGIGTRPDVPLSNCAEVKTVWSVAKRDGALFLKGRLAGERDL